MFEPPPQIDNFTWAWKKWVHAFYQYITRNIQSKGVDIASAATTELYGSTGSYVDITGTTTITSLGTAPVGVRRTAQFDGALTLTHNATSLILPGSENITTAVGDVAEFVSLGGGNWKCIFYTKASQSVVVAPTGWVLLDTQTASGSSELTFTSDIDSSYDNYIFIGTSIIPATDGAELRIRTSSNGGTSYDSGGTDYQYEYEGRDTSPASTSGQSTGASSIMMVAAIGNDSTSGESFDFEARMSNPASTSVRTSFYGRGTGMTTGAVRFRNEFSGERKEKAAVNAVRFYMSSGNMSGTIRMYAIVNS